MKFLKVFTILVFISVSVFAQIGQGLVYLNSEMYTTGKNYYQKLIGDATLRPEACYYLGEIYRLTDKPDSADIYYEMGLKQESPNALCMAGKSSLLWIKDAAQANELIKKALSTKEYKKNPAVYVAVAKSFASGRLYAKAFEALNTAKDLNRNYTDIYLTEGNILMLQEKPGDAAAKFESATSFDPSCKAAYFLEARIYYRGKMNSQAIEILNKLQAIDAKFPPALKLLGDIYYEMGKYAKAIEYYGEYLNTEEAELTDRVRYANALHFNKEYQRSIDEVKKVLPSNQNKPALKRILAYNLDETADYKNGIQTIRDFFNSVDKSEIIATDYRHYAFMLQKDNQDSLAVVNFLKAIEASGGSMVFYKEIATSYDKMKRYEEAAKYYELHVKTGKNIVAADLLYWGRDCYFTAGAIDSTAIAADSTLAIKKLALYTKADSVFGDFTTRYPEHYLGYFWRARVNAVLDPETVLGLAKPYYEKVVEILEKTNNAERKKEMVESYQYLGYYYFLKEDNVNSLVYFEKILSLDPENTVAKQAIEGMKKKG